MEKKIQITSLQQLLDLNSELHHVSSTCLVLAALPLTTYQAVMDRSNLIILHSCKM